MFEIGNCSYNGTGDLSFTHEINVLLVIHDRRCLVATSNLLESYSHKVTRAENAADAFSNLSEGMQKFDLVLVDTGLNDFDAFSLLKLIVKFDTLAILLSDDEDDALLSNAFRSGASMVVRRAPSVDVVKQMRYLVIRERIRKFSKYGEEKNIHCEVIGESGNQSEGNFLTAGNNGRQSRDKGKEKKNSAKEEKRCRKYSNKNQECDSIAVNNSGNGKKKRKVAMEWTQELHDRFVEAINHLGEGKCFPKTIMEQMNVSGLGRRQVASHLQKCRNNTWRSSEVRGLCPSISVQTVSSDTCLETNHPKKFGSMPLFGQNQSNAQGNHLNQQNMISGQQKESDCGQTMDHITNNKGIQDDDNPDDNIKCQNNDSIFSDLGGISTHSNYRLTNQAQLYDHDFPNTQSGLDDPLSMWLLDESALNQGTLSQLLQEPKYPPMENWDMNGPLDDGASHLDKT